MKNECVKKGKELIDLFAKELREYRDKNKNKKDFYINIKGEENNDIIKEKNRVRSLIRTYFPERDCFTLVRPFKMKKNY